MHVGALAPLGLSLAGSAEASTSGAPVAAPAGFGKSKRCLLLYLWGSPSQIDTLDPKPDAPAEIRGSFGSIPTTVPGIRLGEILPRTARLANRVTILRSLTHPHPVHSTAFAMTAVDTPDFPLDDNPRDPRHWPFVGAVVDYLAEQANRTPPQVPRNFGLPFPLGSRRRLKPGPYGGFLGSAYDTIWSEFRARGTREVFRDSGAPEVPTMMVADPYLGVLPTDRFEFLPPAEGMTIDRLHGRALLMEQLDAARRSFDDHAGHQSYDRHRALAFSVLTSGKMRDALDVQSEPSRLREQYGMTLFGQSCLAARRLLEAGGKFITVCWDEYGLVNTGWDTHVYMNSRLGDELGPGFDRAFSSLLTDLDARGMLDETAVVVLSEHGRTPRIQPVAGGGRDHWSRAYSALFTGGGFASGRVVGRTDRIAAEVVETPFSPKDVVATLFHLLGIDPRAEIHDRFGRPFSIGGTGQLRSELLA
ncbi:MAG TPA: DUF1501 domain-containing protein [Pirellulales bacterium]|nr:DUF1501 domain-containing protein [Pirellulales bacterium]